MENSIYLFQLQYHWHWLAQAQLGPKLFSAWQEIGKIETFYNKTDTQFLG